MKRLTRNAIECHNCGTIIESTHRHDMRRCNCESDNDAVWVDGGLDYQRGAFGYDSDFTDVSEYDEGDQP